MQRWEVQRKIQAAEKVTEMDMEIIREMMENIHEHTNRAISEKMEFVGPQIDASRYAPQIPPGGTKLKTVVMLPVPSITSV
jgi:hypothetical protein